MTVIIKARMRDYLIKGLGVVCVARNISKNHHTSYHYMDLFQYSVEAPRRNKVYSVVQAPINNGQPYPILSISECILGGNNDELGFCVPQRR